MAVERVSIESLTVQRADDAVPVLREASVTLAAGEIVGLRGRSGAGKSTLLASVCGLVPWARPAWVEGGVSIDGESVDDLDPAARSRLLGAALDRPEAQLFLATPREELAAASRLHEPAPLLDVAVDALGVRGLLDRRVLELSSGERQRVALACAFAASPRPVLLDEPTSHLDDDGVRGLVRLLDEVRLMGGSVLVAEQAGWRLAAAVTRWVELQDGALRAAEPSMAPALTKPDPLRDHWPVLTARRVAVQRDGVRLVSDLDLVVHRGEIVLLEGPNGAGKSTLAHALAGRSRPWRGNVISEGAVALMMADPTTQLFAETVMRELALSGARNEVIARVLARHELSRLSARAPWTLSRGERQRLLHAALDLLQPAVIVVDEPAQGLDPEDLVQFAELVCRRAARGRAHVIVSHRAELRALAHRVLRLSDGRIVAGEAA